MAFIYKRKDSPIYQACIVVGGKRKRFSTKKRNRGDAQKEATRVETEENDRLRKTGGISLIEAAEFFFRTRDLKAKTKATYKTNLAQIFNHFGDIPLSSITDLDVSLYIRERVRSSTTIMVRRELAFLSSLISSVKPQDNHITRNVVKEYDKSALPDAKKRTTWATVSDFQKLLSACNQPYQKLFLLLAVSTGMRANEILGLTWDEIDLVDGLIVLGNQDDQRTKSGNSKLIPLTDTLRDTLLTVRKTARSSFVVANPNSGKRIGSIQKAWSGIRTRAGLPTFRIHDLRHTFCSWGKQAGLDDKTLMDLMGHKTRSMVDRYGHTSTESLTASIKQMERNTKMYTGTTVFSKEKDRTE